ncbi:MAG: putative gamma-glutamyltranspeptidase [Clostridia bacterium 41_269]|nr:MAG: putative gamma-glutamyltranspeptidase [Clostridia bacterium 41_269]
MINFEKIEGEFIPSGDGKCAEAKGGMVSTAFPEATEAGIRMLKRGGNAVDAACAAAFALAVCEPQASGLGGQTMALVHYRGKTFAVDGSSRAPSLAHPDVLKKEDLQIGYLAATVPSTPAVLNYLYFHYGTLRREEILEPAIQIAAEGYRTTELQSLLQKNELERFFEVPSRSGAKYFLKNGKEPYEPGELFVQKDLAELLKRLSRKGIKEFYQGEVARQIDADMRKNGGLIRYDDLALIPWPIERKVIKRRYRELTVATMPPPGAGRTLLLLLRMLEFIPSEILTEKSLKSYHLLAELMRKAYRESMERPYDPNFFPQVKRKVLLQKSFARELAASVAEEIDSSLPITQSADELLDHDTTHLAVMDRWGNAVSLTQSIEKVYGSHAAAEGLGFLYNNYMMDFVYEDPSHPYYLRPNAVPWSSACPTIIFHRGKPWMAVGSPGSERIFSTIAQFLIHIVEEGVDMGEAMRRPRLHCSLGGLISIEADRFPEDIIEGLKAKGYRIDKRSTYSYYLGCVQAVLRRHKRKGFQGVADIRGDGTAGGPD